MAVVKNRLEILAAQRHFFEQLAYEAVTHREQQWRADAVALAQRAGLLLDLGGGSAFQGYIRRDDLGTETTYCCLDISTVARPTAIGDALHLPIASASVNNIFCNAVLEHVADPYQVVREMHRVLVDGGEAMVAVPFIYPYHDQVDYHRFTDTALRQMFQTYRQVRIEPVGDYFFVVLLFLTGFQFGVARYLDHCFNPLRLLLQIAPRWLAGKNDSALNRKYLRSIRRSPVGWHIYCSK